MELPQVPPAWIDYINALSTVAVALFAGVQLFREWYGARLRRLATDTQTAAAAEVLHQLLVTDYLGSFPRLVSDTVAPDNLDFRDIQPLWGWAGRWNKTRDTIEPQMSALLSLTSGGSPGLVEPLRGALRHMLKIRVHCERLVFLLEEIELDMEAVRSDPMRNPERLMGTSAMVKFWPHSQNRLISHMAEQLHQDLLDCIECLRLVAQRGLRGLPD
jgi:hypothetical protein